VVDYNEEYSSATGHVKANRAMTGIVVFASDVSWMIDRAESERRSPPVLLPAIALVGDLGNMNELRPGLDALHAAGTAGVVVVFGFLLG
jgi:hypothetical protein